MKSLWAANELVKNDFRYSTYVVKLKPSVELPIVPESRWIVDVIPEFDDNKEIQEEKEYAQYIRDRLELDFEMIQLLGLESKLRTVDVSFQIIMSTKCTQGEKLVFKPLIGGGIFGGAKQNQQGLEVFDSKKKNSRPLIKMSKINPLSLDIQDLQRWIVSLNRREKKGTISQRMLKPSKQSS